MGPRTRRFPCQRGMATYCVLIVACFYCCIPFPCVLRIQLKPLLERKFLSLDCPPFFAPFFFLVCCVSVHSMCYTRLHLFEIFVGIILPPNIWAGYVTASFTWNGLFSPFPCGIDFSCDFGDFPRSLCSVSRH